MRFMYASPGAAPGLDLAAACKRHRELMSELRRSSADTMSYLNRRIETLNGVAVGWLKHAAVNSCMAATAADSAEPAPLSTAVTAAVAAAPAGGPSTSFVSPPPPKSAASYARPVPAATATPAVRAEVAGVRVEEEGGDAPFPRTNEDLYD